MKSTHPTQALVAQGLSKAWQRDPHRRVVLFNGLSLCVDRGQSVAIMGASGAGKSSLLHVLAGLDAAHTGDVFIAGNRLTATSRSQRARLRRRHIGIALQQGGLIQTLTVRENITLACWLDGRTPDANQCDVLLEQLQMRHLGDSYPAALSGGEAARVGVGRAVFGAPRLIVCDEPTGALDATSTACVLAVLHEAVALGSALVVATHDAQVAHAMDRCATLTEGALQWGTQP